jgi:large subunit ribosomal protein L18
VSRRHRRWGPSAKLETMKINTKADRRERVHLRQRKRIVGTQERPRLSVFRSRSHIYAQVIDDLNGQTLASASSVEAALKGAFAKDIRGGNRKGAEAIGKAIAERSIGKGIKRVVFDRGGFLYHGRIRAVADAARKSGLEF